MTIQHVPHGLKFIRQKPLRIRHNPKRDGMPVLSHRWLHILKRIHHKSVSLIKCNPSGFQFTGRQFHLQYNRSSALPAVSEVPLQVRRFGMISSQQNAPQTGMYQTPTLPETPSVPRVHGTRTSDTRRHPVSFSAPPWIVSRPAENSPP